MSTIYFSEWLSKYLQYLQMHSYSEKTIASYEQGLRRFGHYLFILRTTRETRPVREWKNKAHQRLDTDIMATSEEILLYISFLTNCLKYKPKTMYRILSTIHSYYRYIEHQTDNKSVINPVSGSMRPKIEGSISNFLNHEQVLELLDSVDNTRDQLIIHLIYATGVRISELCAISIEDISFETQTIQIKGRNNKIRSVFIDLELLDAIRQYIGTRTSGPLFFGHQNNQIAPRTIQHIFKQYAPAGITPHTLRYSYAVKLYHQTGDIHIVQKNLGYTSSQQTMFLYTQSALTPGENSAGCQNFDEMTNSKENQMIHTHIVSGAKMRF